MPKIKVELNRAGMRELLKSAEIATELNTRMLRAQAQIPGSELRESRSPTRVRVRLYYGNVFQEANSGKLSRALDASGGRRGTQQVKRKR
jgi:hypothetical protein